MVTVNNATMSATGFDDQRHVVGTFRWQRSFDVTDSGFHGFPFYYRVRA